MDMDGKCSERGGGVHQICIRNISKSTLIFPKTGQSNHGTNNHCVFSAWSYITPQNELIIM